MNVTPDSIVELWIRTLAKHGIGSLWISNCLHMREHDPGGEDRPRRGLDPRRSSTSPSPVTPTTTTPT